MTDPINHPAHYTQAGGLECIDVLDALGVSDDFCRGNAIKYLWRMYDKGTALEDAKKARWYIDRLIKSLEKQPHQA